MLRKLTTALGQAALSCHVWLYRRSRGRFGGSVRGTPILLLTTTGRKTGARRTRPLGYYRDDSTFVLCGSNGGSDRSPAWVYNLRSRPTAEVEVGEETVAVTGWEAAGDEYDRLWRAFSAANPQYVRYLEKTQRRLPLVVLEPTG